jgi:hypothetical protein
VFTILCIASPCDTKNICLIHSSIFFQLVSLDERESQYNLLYISLHHQVIYWLYGKRMDSVIGIQRKKKKGASSEITPQLVWNYVPGTRNRIQVPASRNTHTVSMGFTRSLIINCRYLVCNRSNLFCCLSSFTLLPYRHNMLKLRPEALFAFLYPVRTRQGPNRL